MRLPRRSQKRLRLRPPRLPRKRLRRQPWLTWLRSPQRSGRPDIPTTSFAAEAELAEAEAALGDTEAAEADDAMQPDEAAADAHDEALLDMIAMEMGAPDPFDGDEVAEPFATNTHLAEPAPVEPAIVAQAPEPVMTTVQAPADLRPQSTAQTTAQAAPEASLEISLGSSIIASGIVRKPAVAANDPLAPIRRMSQAEKIAFFS